MIRKLRLKIVGISVVTVAVVLVSALVILALSTRSQMAQSSEARLYEALEGKLDKSELPGSSGLPCFVAEVYSGGTIRLSGSSYYNLQDEEMVLHIVQAALEREDDSGVLGDYSLRYLRRIGVVSVRIAFTDCTMEQATMRSLLLRSGLVALAALAVLAGLSYCLAGLVVGPVKRAWQEQKQFVSDASHELKTPLTVILSSSELAAEEQDVQRTKQYVEGIHAESLRMKALVEDMLTLARTESGTRPETEAVDLSDTVLESVLAFEPVAFESGRELVYDIQPGRASCVGDFVGSSSEASCGGIASRTGGDGWDAEYRRAFGEASGFEVGASSGGIGGRAGGGGAGQPSSVVKAERVSGVSFVEHCGFVQGVDLGCRCEPGGASV